MTVAGVEGVAESSDIPRLSSNQIDSISQSYRTALQSIPAKTFHLVDAFCLDFVAPHPAPKARQVRSPPGLERDLTMSDDREMSWKMRIALGSEMSSYGYDLTGRGIWGKVRKVLVEDWQSFSGFVETCYRGCEHRSRDLQRRNYLEVVSWLIVEWMF
jgi:hypothetical protein